MNKTVEKISVALVGVISALYIINPTMGIIELIPDNIPIIGNLDEAAATTVLLGVLAYFGLDLSKVFKGVRREETPAERPAKGKVVGTATAAYRDKTEA